MSMVHLASSSPRRRELLGQIGLTPKIVCPDIDETPVVGESPADLVSRLSREKAAAGLRLIAGAGVVVAADTVVVIDGAILGKPRDMQDACQIWGQLSGREHQVLTGVTVADGDRTETRVVMTSVTFRSLSLAEMQAYWDSGEPADKAGAYGIQGRGAVFIDSINGSYSNVVGLPLAETAAMLAGFGIDIWAGQ